MPVKSVLAVFLPMSATTGDKSWSREERVSEERRESGRREERVSEGAEKREPLRGEENLGGERRESRRGVQANRITSHIPCLVSEVHPATSPEWALVMEVA